MKSMQKLYIKLNREEKTKLDDAAEVLEEILCHLVANKDLGLTPSQDGIDIYDSFWKIFDICWHIDKDKLIPKDRQVIDKETIADSAVVYELMICFGNGGYIYYNTLKANLKEALHEWADAMNECCINTDNLEPTYACLRDLDDNITEETRNVLW